MITRNVKWREKWHTVIALTDKVQDRAENSHINGVDVGAPIDQILDNIEFVVSAGDHEGGESVPVWGVEGGSEPDGPQEVVGLLWFCDRCSLCSTTSLHMSLEK